MGGRRILPVQALCDDSESLIESEAELESTIKGGYQIGIEVGFASVMDHAARMKQQ